MKSPASLPFAALQKEIEAYYTDELGVLFPFYHIAYWMGLSSNDGLYPNFKWLDYNTKPPGDHLLHASLAHHCPAPCSQMLAPAL